MGPVPDLPTDGPQESTDIKALLLQVPAGWLWKSLWSREWGVRLASLTPHTTRQARWLLQGHGVPFGSELGCGAPPALSPRTALLFVPGGREGRREGGETPGTAMRPALKALSSSALPGFRPGV